jgi:sugar phosphate isomerase/epimerase
MSRIGIFAKTFPGQTAEGVLTAARDAGYACVQFNLSCCGLHSMPDSIAPETVAAIAAASAKTGVSLAALSGTYNMIHPDPKVRAQGLGRLRILLSQARPMGTNLVTLCTGTRDPADQWRAHPENESPEAWADLLTEMAQAAAMAEEFGVDLGIEPEPANVVGSAARAARLMREISSPRLRIILDPANLAAGTNADQDRIFETAADFLHERIALAHAKDRDAAGEIVPPGQGIIDFPRFFAHLTRVGFRGPIITHGIAAEDAPQVARFLTQTLGP